MIESTKITITKEQLDSLLLNYYKKYFEDENVTIVRVVSRDSYTDDEVTTKIKRKVKIGTYEAEKEYILNDDEVEGVINENLEQYGYKVSYYNYNIKNSCVSSVNVSVNKLEKVKQKTL